MISEQPCFQSKHFKNLFYQNKKLLKSNSGFTLVELILIIILLGILSVTAYVKWPTGLDNRAAMMEMKRAIRHTQHIAMTRAYSEGNIWRLAISGDQYTIKNDASGYVPDEFINRKLLNSSSTTINNSAAITLYFNGLGEPVDSLGTAKSASQTLLINNTINLTICPETGFVKEGQNCP